MLGKRTKKPQASFPESGTCCTANRAPDRLKLGDPHFLPYPLEKVAFGEMRD